MSQFIQILSTAQPLPLGTLLLLCVTWILIRLIRRGPELLRGVAEVIRAKKGD